jgi:PKD repeat protein
MKPPENTTTFAKVEKTALPVDAVPFTNPKKCTFSLTVPAKKCFMMVEMSFMKPLSNCFLRTSAAICVACGFVTLASAQNLTLRVVCYNIEDDINGATTPLPGLIFPSSGNTATTNGGVLEGIGEEILSDGIAQPIDILALEETTSNPQTIAPIVAGLNAFYTVYNPLAANMYAMSTYQATESGGVVDDGNGPNAMVYNTKTVQLLASVPVDPPGGTGALGSSSGEYREVMRYEFAPAGQTPTAATEFYVYVSHYKSGGTSTDEVDREGEAVIIRNNETSLPATARVLYVGDFNIGSNSEASYQTICATNSPGGGAQGQGIDPLATNPAIKIDWTVNSLLNVKTEEDYSLHYRDDLQVGTTNIYYGFPGGLALVSGTYHAFGNNGTTAYEESVDDGTDTALNSDLAPGSTLSASTLYADLIGASDHLPVVADYTIPVVQPVAIFTAAPTNPALPPLAVTFTDASTGIVTNWFWNFGDGATSNTYTMTSVSHTYTTAGTYTVTETVTGPGGSNTLMQSNLITVYQPPAAGFSATPTNGVVPLSVTFTDASTGIVTNWFWNFGDGGTSNLTTANVAYTYNTPGVYTVTETVTGPGGMNTSTQTTLITVLTPFQAWQIQYFGSTTNSEAQPDADADGTGQNNLFKYIAGLNPTDPTSVFVFNIVSVPNQPTYENLVFSPAVAGCTYTPVFSTDLLNGPWAPLTTAASPPVTNGTQVTITDTNATQLQGFYQIEISGPP